MNFTIQVMYLIFDLDENPEKGNNNPYIYQGDCHPIHHESNYVLIVYCKRSDEEENNHFVHYLSFYYK